MSAKGHYELELKCDDRAATGERCSTNLTITDETRGEAKALARNNGWMIDRYDRAYCPEHRVQRRHRAS